ncbi:hypothetical protein K8I61_02265 [bacterium]|nr:hypothetical protein [bacterium]
MTAKGMRVRGDVGRNRELRMQVLSRLSVFALIFAFAHAVSIGCDGGDHGVSRDETAVDDNDDAAAALPEDQPEPGGSGYCWDGVWEIVVECQTVALITGAHEVTPEQWVELCESGEEMILCMVDCAWASDNCGDLGWCVNDCILEYAGVGEDIPCDTAMEILFDDCGWESPWPSWPFDRDQAEDGCWQQDLFMECLAGCALNGDSCDTVEDCIDEWCWDPD